MKAYFLRKLSGVVWVLCLTLLISGCDRSKEAGGASNPPTMLRNTKHQESTRQALLSFSSKKILFGHHSVGTNIIEGMRNIAQQENIVLNITPVTVTDPIEKEGLYHFSPGKNGQPETKVDEFVRFLTAGHDKGFDIAFMKFCFVDIIPGSNVEKIFGYYKQNIEALQQRYPTVRFIHCTVPLTAQSVSIKDRMKRVLGLQVWGDEANRLRTDYNSLLLRTFGEGIVFDLAGIESTRADGSRCKMRYNGKNIFCLVPEYTDDGGHLNLLGKRVVATAMINFLGNIKINED